MTINEIQDELIAEFELVEDWMDRYQMIIEFSKDLEPLEEAYKLPEHLIDGCQSRVWIVSEEKDGVMHLMADSDALIVKGIAAMLVRILNGQKAEDIANCDLYFIDRIGLREHLSPNRSNGLLAMISHIKRDAVQALSK